MLRHLLVAHVDASSCFVPFPSLPSGSPAFARVRGTRVLCVVRAARPWTRRRRSPRAAPTRLSPSTHTCRHRHASRTTTHMLPPPPHHRRSSMWRRRRRSRCDLRRSRRRCRHHRRVHPRPMLRLQRLHQQRRERVPVPSRYHSRCRRNCSHIIPSRSSTPSSERTPREAEHTRIGWGMRGTTSTTSPPAHICR